MLSQQQQQTTQNQNTIQNQYNPYDPTFLDSSIDDPTVFQIADTRKRDYSKYTEDFMEFNTVEVNMKGNQQNRANSDRKLANQNDQLQTPQTKHTDRSQTPDYLNPTQNNNGLRQSQVKSRSMNQRHNDLKQQEQSIQQHHMNIAQSSYHMNAINITTTITDQSLQNQQEQTPGQYNSLVTQIKNENTGKQQIQNAARSDYTTNHSTQNNINGLINANQLSQSYNQNEIQLQSTLNSTATENLYKIYDQEEGCFRDIRELSDELCTLDSTTFFDKRAGKKFTTLPRSSIVSKFWSIFWNQKDKANNNLIKACRDGNLKKISKLLNKYREPEKIADIHFCDKNGYTALHTCAKFNQYDAMNLLLTAGEADINFLTQNEQRQTALHIATIEQHLLLVKSMIQEFNADLNTALHYCIQTKNRKLLRIILDGKPDVNLANNEGLTSLEMSSNYNLQYDIQSYVNKGSRKLSEQTTGTYKSNQIFQVQTQATNKGTINQNYKQLLEQQLKQNNKLEDLIINLSSPKTIENTSTNVRLSGETSYQDGSSNRQNSTQFNNNYQNQPNQIQDNTNYEQLMIQKLKETQEIRNRLKDELKNDKQLNVFRNQLDDNRLPVELHVTIYDFIPIAKLGQGSYGEVFLVEEINTKKQYAMKMLDKAKVLEQELLRYTITEKEILQKSNHPFIVKLFFAFQTSKYFFLIQEFCPCGDMAKLLTKQKRFSEDIARLYIAEVLLAIEYLHSKNIIYRDLKPDNIIIDKDGHLKLTDFGLSKENVDTEFHSNSFVGSYAYAAPEIIKHKAHGKSLDWYGLGALLYELLVGIPPYYDKSQEVMFNNIVNGTIKIPMMLSHNAKDLITKLLRRNPLKRLGASDIGAKEIKDHPFFEGIDWNDVIYKKTYPPFKNRKVVRREQIDLERYIEMIGSTDEDKMDDWSFIRVHED